MGGRRQKFKAIKPGIYILGEGLTERYYFSHLKRIFNFKCTVGPRFFFNTCVADFESRIRELLRGDILIICVFDADVSERDIKENQRFQNLRKKYSRNKNVLICDSFPSIEYWFLIHFKDTCPHFENSSQVLTELKKHMSKYKRTEAFLENEKWVRDMSINFGSIESARQRAEKYRTRKASYSNIYKAINKLSASIN
jgi:hypothetical protein